MRRSINWLNVSTLISLALLVGTELFGTAWAAGWALGGLLQLPDWGVLAIELISVALSCVAVVAFMRKALEKEPIFYKS